jgi:hypothetical protein
MTKRRGFLISSVRKSRALAKCSILCAGSNSASKNHFHLGLTLNKVPSTTIPGRNPPLGEKSFSITFFFAVSETRLLLTTLPKKIFPGATTFVGSAVFLREGWSPPEQIFWKLTSIDSRRQS